MIISINVEGVFDKIKHLFMIKALKKLGTAGIYLNIKKRIYNKPLSNIMLNREKLEVCPLKIRKKKKGMNSLHSFSILCSNS
jgi:hypothetical protein